MGYSSVSDLKCFWGGTPAQLCVSMHESKFWSKHGFDQYVEGELGPETYIASQHRSRLYPEELLLGPELGMKAQMILLNLINLV